MTWPLRFRALTGLPTVADGSVSIVERRLERETGIEPATNSLEGCDSTTELLPPPRSHLARLALRRAARVRTRFRRSAHSALTLPIRLPALDIAHARVGSPTDARRCERRLVAREGLEPSKPLGRQIYSLLRLTASLPRQICLVGIRVFDASVLLSVTQCCCVSRSDRCAHVPRSRLELAKGFEPPTC